jgi:hypothetical protein
MLTVNLMDKKWIWPAFGLAAVLVGAAGFGAAYKWTHTPPLLPPLSSEQVVIKATPSVILAVRDLQKLESAELHIERVMDVRNKESHMLGLIEAEDALLLVASGDVVAGIDLSAMKEGDIDANWNTKSVKIVLPPPTVFSTRLDNEHTYVYSRNVDLLAKRKENLESEARTQAERELAKAASDAGILERANKNASRTVEGLVRALGYEHVEIVTTKP